MTRWSQGAGWLAVVAGVLIFSTDGIVIRQITLPPIAISFWVQAASAMILLLSQCRRLPCDVKILQKHPSSLRLLLVMGLLRAIDTLAFITAIFWAPIAKVIVVAYLFPIFTMLLAYRFLGERVAARSLVAALIALAGIVVLVLPELGPTAAGDLPGLILAGVVSLVVAIKRVLIKGVNPDIPTKLIVLTEVVLAAIFLAPFLLFLTSSGPVSSQNIIFIVLAGVLYGIVANAIILSGLRVVPAGPAAVVGYLEPVAASLLAWWLLSESISYYTFIGGMFVLVGSLATVLSQMDNDKLVSTPYRDVNGGGHAI